MFPGLRTEWHFKKAARNLRLQVESPSLFCFFIPSLERGEDVFCGPRDAHGSHVGRGGGGVGGGRVHGVHEEARVGLGPRHGLHVRHRRRRGGETAEALSVYKLAGLNFSRFFTLDLAGNFVSFSSSRSAHFLTCSSTRSPSHPMPPLTSGSSCTILPLRYCSFSGPSIYYCASRLS